MRETTKKAWVLFVYFFTQIIPKSNKSGVRINKKNLLSNDAHIFCHQHSYFRVSTLQNQDCCSPHNSCVMLAVNRRTEIASKIIPKNFRMR